MAYTVRLVRCKSPLQYDKALSMHDCFKDQAPFLLSQRYHNRIGLYRYQDCPDLQNVTFFSFFFGGKHSYCVALTQTANEPDSPETAWVLFEGNDEDSGREALDKINQTLAPLLAEGTVCLSDDLLDAIITPFPVPPDDIPDIVLEMIENNPKGHPDWPLVVQALLHIENRSNTAINGHDSTVNPAVSLRFQRMSSYVAGDEDDVFTSPKSPATPVDVINLHNAAKEDKSESIRKVMVRKVTLHSQSGAYDSPDAGQSLTSLGGASGCSLGVASPFHHPPLIEASDEYSLDLDPVDVQSQDTPLYSSVEKGYVKSSMYFLLGGANPNFVHPVSGDTCLHLAAKQGIEESIKLLVTFGADPAIKNKDGETPADLLPDTAKCSQEIRSLFEEIQTLNKEYESLPNDPISVAATPPSDDSLYLLAFDGGGSRCISALQMLIAVEKRMRDINPNCLPFISHFDYVAGTSGGAFLAMMLIYNRNSLKDARALNVNGSTYLSGKTVYDKSRNVEQLIKNTLGTERVMSDVPTPRCILTATLANAIPPKLHLLTNYGSPRNDQPGPDEQTIWEAARMSSAAPTYLLSYNNAIDGGVMANNPTVDAIVEMNEQAMKETGHPVKLGCVLSMGCGVESPVHVERIDTAGYSFGIQGLANAVDGYKNLISLMISSVTQTEGQDISRAKALCDMGGGVYYRLTPPIERAIPLDTNNPVELIQPMFDSFMYTLRNPQLVDSVARTLLAKPNLY